VPVAIGWAIHETRGMSEIAVNIEQRRRSKREDERAKERHEVELRARQMANIREELELWSLVDKLEPRLREEYEARLDQLDPSQRILNRLESFKTQSLEAATELTVGTEGVEFEEWRMTTTPASEEAGFASGRQNWQKFGHLNTALGASFALPRGVGVLFVTGAWQTSSSPAKSLRPVGVAADLMLGSEWMLMDMTMGPMMGWTMMLAWLLFLVVLVVGAVFLFRGPSDRGVRGSSSALGILEDRFARGEIDREEFEERRRTLLS